LELGSTLSPLPHCQNRSSTSVRQGRRS